MFIRQGNTFINSQYVVQIRLRARSQPAAANAAFIMHDGSEIDGFATESNLDLLAATIVPAPPGYEAYRQYDMYFDEDGVPEKLDWKPVIAFAFFPGVEMLAPITADGGCLEKYGVREPDGTVYTSSETFFKTADDYLASLRSELAKKGSA
jgi:hypothetical protein